MATTSTYHFTTARLPGDARYQPPHQYQCSRGHWVETERPTTACSACPLGEPCDGELRPVRTERAS